MYLTEKSTFLTKNLDTFDEKIQRKYPPAVMISVAVAKNLKFRPVFTEKNFPTSGGGCHLAPFSTVPYAYGMNQNLIQKKKIKLVSRNLCLLVYGLCTLSKWQ